MTSRFSFRFVSFFCLSSCVFLGAYSGSEKYTDSVLYVGVFKDAETEKHVFTEKRKNYFFDQNMVYTKIMYYTPQGELCAVKESEYGENKYVPKLTRDELSLEKKTVATVREGMVSMNQNNRGKVTNANFSVPDSAILDEGFQHYVFENIHKLIEGEKLSFPLIVVEREGYYNFTLEAVSVDLENNRVELKMAPLHWALALLVDDIYLTIDTKHRYMIQYRGVLNFKSCSEANKKVLGTFEKRGFDE